MIKRRKNLTLFGFGLTYFKIVIGGDGTIFGSFPLIFRQIFCSIRHRIAFHLLKGYMRKVKLINN